MSTTTRTRRADKRLLKTIDLNLAAARATKLDRINREFGPATVAQYDEKIRLLQAERDEVVTRLHPFRQRKDWGIEVPAFA